MLFIAAGGNARVAFQWTDNDGVELDANVETVSLEVDYDDNERTETFALKFTA